MGRRLARASRRVYQSDAAARLIRAALRLAPTRSGRARSRRLTNSLRAVVTLRTAWCRADLGRARGRRLRRAWHYFGIFGGARNAYHLRQRLLRPGEGDSDTEAANRLLSASYAALGRRWIGRRLGWRTALERVLEPLEVRCQATLHEWLARAAVSRLGSRPVGARRPRLSRTPRGCAGAGRGPRSS